MKLRTEMYIVTAVMPVLLLVLYFIGAGAYAQMASGDEEKSLEASTNYVASWLTLESVKTVNASQYWAKSVDAKFMEDPGGNLEAKFDDLSFIAAGADVLAIYDSYGNLVASKGVDFEKGARFAVPPFFGGLEPSGKLLSGKNGMDGGGLAIVSGKPMVVYPQHVRGMGKDIATVVAGRYVRLPDLNQLLAMKGMNASFYLYSQVGTSLENDDTINRGARVPIVRSEKSAKSYVVQNDMDGKPALVVWMETPRESYAMLMGMQVYLIVGVCAIGVTMMFVMFVLLDLVVVMRVERIHKYADDVKKMDNPKYFKAIPQDKNLEDDISGLSEDINSLLQKIVDDKQTLVLSEVEYSGRLKDEVDKKTEMLQVANEHLRKLEQQKNQFLFNIGHDLKTPLAVIEMNVAILKSDKVKPAQKNDSDGLIKRNLSKLKEEIEEIIQLSRYETGSDDTESKEDVDFCEVVKAEVGSYRDFAKVKGLDIKLIGADRKVMVRGDHRQLAYALSNLLSNAVKFSTDKDIEVKVSQDDDNITVAVTDYGVGVAPADRKNLFQKFFKGDNTGPGTGVGLFITKQIAEKHKGSVKYEPSKVKGSVFYFVLPKKR